jgi:hypothetical protein
MNPCGKRLIKQSRRLWVFGYTEKDVLEMFAVSALAA